MADIVTELANKCGISPDVARKGLGLILGLLKSKLPAESFAKVSAAVPGAENLMAATAETCEQPSGGVAGAVKGAVSSVLGGGAGDALAKFSQLGMSPDQIHEFVPKVLECLKGKVPDNVMNQISGLLPTPQEAVR